MKQLNYYITGRSKYLSIVASYIAVSTLYIFFASNLPVSIIAGANYDDALFIKNAISLMQGDWLGQYNNLTLVKGAGFPIFLAVNNAIGTPITFLFSIFYVFSCGLVTYSLYRAGLNKVIAFISFTIILFHPYLLPTRIIREDIYTALTLIVVSGFTYIFFIYEGKTKYSIITPLYGLFFGYFWITREEGLWIVPAFIFFIFVSIWLVKKYQRSYKDIIYKVTLYILSTLIPIIGISITNYYSYGKYQTVDIKDKEFKKALKSLYSVQNDINSPYLPVSRQKREMIYKISPAFSNIRDYLEHKGKNWKFLSCRIYPSTCGDYAGGFFMWALRDAVAAKGYYKSPTRASKYYRNLTNEIQTACNQGTLMCKRNQIPFMPNITSTQLWLIPKELGKALTLSLVQSPVPIIAGPSWGNRSKFNKYLSFLGNPEAIPLISSSEMRETQKGHGINLDRYASKKQAHDIKLKIMQKAQHYLEFMKLKRIMIYIYKLIVPILVLMGLVTYVYYFISSIKKKYQCSDLFFIATALWILILSRIALLILIDISSFPAITVQYMQPVFILLCLSALVSVNLIKYQQNNKIIS